MTPDYDLSPGAMKKVVHAAVNNSSFRQAEENLLALAEMHVSCQRIRRSAKQIGEQLRRQDRFKDHGNFPGGDFAGPEMALHPLHRGARHLLWRLEFFPMARGTSVRPGANRGFSTVTVSDNGAPGMRTRVTPNTCRWYACGG